MHWVSWPIYWVSWPIYIYIQHAMDTSPKKEKIWTINMPYESLHLLFEYNIPSTIPGVRRLGARIITPQVMAMDGMGQQSLFYLVDPGKWVPINSGGPLRNPYINRDRDRNGWQTIEKEQKSVTYKCTKRMKHKRNKSTAKNNFTEQLRQAT